jgi:uncharacterized damage-inducible protein DinB
LDVRALPEILERVRGTPVRVEERVRGLPPELSTWRLGEQWSIQENVGHLLDLEPLWSGRLDDLIAGLHELRSADLENRKTHEAAHNQRNLTELLAEFRAARMATVARLETLAGAVVQRTAIHPRLQQPMTVVDLFFFVAEHDDHHLARIAEILRAVA